MTHALNLANDLGRGVIAEAVSVGRPAVSNAINRGALPSAWYGPLSKVARSLGKECPVEAFNWKSELPPQEPEGAAQ